MPMPERKKNREKEQPVVNLAYPWLALALQHAADDAIFQRRAGF